jgi:hypothetical protein
MLETKDPDKSLDFNLKRGDECWAANKDSWYEFE